MYFCEQRVFNWDTIIWIGFLVFPSFWLGKNTIQIDCQFWRIILITWLFFGKTLKKDGCDENQFYKCAPAIYYFVPGVAAQHSAFFLNHMVSGKKNSEGPVGNKKLNCIQNIQNVMCCLNMFHLMSIKICYIWKAQSTNIAHKWSFHRMFSSFMSFITLAWG